MRALLVSPLGLLIGLALGALGAGGSILAVPALVYGAGLDPKGATTGSLLLVGVAALVGLVPHARAGRVRAGTGIAFGVTGIGGSLAGSALNHRVDPDVLLLGFSALVLLAAWRMVTGCPTCTRVGEARAAASASTATPTSTPRSRSVVEGRTVVAVLLAGTGVGLLTGLFGVGGGFVIVPALTLVLKLPLSEAVGTSLLVIAVNSTSGLAPRLAGTSIDWAVVAPFVAAAIAGVLVGGRLAGRVDPRRSLRAFAALLVIVAAYTALRAGVALRA